MTRRILAAVTSRGKTFQKFKAPKTFKFSERRVACGLKVVTEGEWCWGVPGREVNGEPGPR